MYNHWLCWCWKSLSWHRQCLYDLWLILRHHVIEIKSSSSSESFLIPTFLDRLSLESTHLVLLIMSVISSPLMINYFLLKTAEMVSPSCSRVLPKAASIVAVNRGGEFSSPRHSSVQAQHAWCPAHTAALVAWNKKSQGKPLGSLWGTDQVFP